MDSPRCLSGYPFARRQLTLAGRYLRLPPRFPTQSCLHWANTPTFKYAPPREPIRTTHHEAASETHTGESSKGQREWEGPSHQCSLFFCPIYLILFWTACNRANPQQWSQQEDGWGCGIKGTLGAFQLELLFSSYVTA